MKKAFYRCLYIFAAISFFIAFGFVGGVQIGTVALRTGLMIATASALAGVLMMAILWEVSR